MLGLYTGMKLNVELKPLVVNSHQYSCGDLSSYYVSTYLLYENEQGVFIPCLVEEVTEDKVFRISFKSPSEDRSSGFSMKRRNVRSESLYRFTPSHGFYISKGSGRLIKMAYGNDRSYKKGIRHDQLRWWQVDANGKCIEFRPDPLRLMWDVLYPTFRSRHSIILSRRLCIHKQNLITAYKALKVGSMNENTLKTPFQCVQDRLEDGYERTRGIRCQITQI